MANHLSDPAMNPAMNPAVDPPVDSPIDPSTDSSPPPGLLIADHFHKQDDYHVRRLSGTKDWLFTFTLGGTGIFTCNRQQITCTEGDVAILAPGTVHDYATAQGEQWEFVWAHFLPRLHWLKWLQLPQIHNGLYYLHIDHALTRQQLIHAFQRLQKNCPVMNPFQEALSLNALEEILIHIAHHFKQHQSNLDPRIEEVLRLLADRMAEPLTVDELAQSVSLSPSRLSHLFKEQVGDSIIKTLLKMRLQQAARLLQFTTRQVNEIAHDVGFASPFYLTRQFKVYYGMSPTQYRANMQTASDDNESGHSSSLYQSSSVES
jgi:AraC family transcriptional regulator, arabinose operon regulatory protein